MELADTETPPDEGHVYRIESRPVNQWMLLVILVGLGAPFVFWWAVPWLASLRSGSGSLEWLWCLVGLFAPALALALAYAQLLQAFRRRTYVRITPEELEYFTPGLRIRTPWANIEKIDNGVAFLREADLREVQFWGWFWSLSAHVRHRRREPAITQMIPLWMFHWAKSSPLVHDIRRYAPHLDQRWLNQVPYREFLEE
jgi:hypothetical protein